jgi:geranylgeranyl pyrophosphate synthase
MERNAELRSLVGKEFLSEADVQRATLLLEEAGSRIYAERLAQEHHERALEALDRANLHRAEDGALRQLTQELLNRRH